MKDGARQAENALRVVWNVEEDGVAPVSCNHLVGMCAVHVSRWLKEKRGLMRCSKNHETMTKDLEWYKNVPTLELVPVVKKVRLRLPLTALSSVS